MPRHVTKTSFKKGQIRTEESKNKQSKTVRRLYRLGLIKINPIKIWTKESKEHMVKLCKERSLERKPIGSTRHQKCGKKTYILVKVNSSGLWKYQHRIVMQNYIGRPLFEKEIVHHKNGNTFDNRIENLEIVDNYTHNKIHNTPEVMQERAEKNKHLWSLNGRWSKKHPECIECHSTRVVHVGRGLCNNCYSRIVRNRCK